MVGILSLVATHSNKKRSETFQSHFFFLFHLSLAYSAEMAPMGQAPAQVPQSTQVLASIL